MASRVRVDVVYAYCVQHGGPGRVIAELLGRMPDPSIFRVLTLAQTVGIPSQIRTCVVGSAGKAFMDGEENLAFSGTVKLIVGDKKQHLLHSFGIYDIEPDIYSAQICLAAYFDSFTRFFGRNRLATEIPSWTHMRDLEAKMLERLEEHRIVATSRKVTRELEFYYGLDSKKIHVVHNSSRLPRAFPEGRRLPPFKVGFVGNNIYAKGLPFLKKALNHLVRDMPIVCYGAGCDRVTAQFMTRGSRFKFHCLGMCDLGIDFYEKLDCLVAASIYESHSLSILEAMAQGVPVVFTTTTGNYQDVMDSTALTLAVLEDPTDWTRLRLTIERLLTDPAYARQVTDAGHTVSDLYSWDRAAHYYWDLYMHP